jgi:hypothetical protein
MTEIEKLILGALNVLLAQAAARAEASNVSAPMDYYNQWLRRLRELEKK